MRHTPTVGLVRQFGTMAAIRAIGMAAMFVTGIVLARTLGPAGLGVLTYAQSWAEVLTIVAIMGIPAFVIREAAVLRHRGALGEVRGLLRWGWVVSLLASCALAGGMVVLVRWTGFPAAGDESARATQLAMLLVPLGTLLLMAEASLAALRHAMVSIVPALLLRPLVYLGLIGLAAAWRADRLDPITTLWLSIAAVAACLCFAGALVLRLRPPALRAAAPRYHPWPWLKASIPFALVYGMYIIHTRIDVLILGSLMDERAVGIYTVAARAAELVAFGTGTIALLTRAEVARLHAANDQALLRHLLYRSAVLSLIAAAATVALFAVAGRWLLSLFGSEFPEGWSVMMILAVGQALIIGGLPRYIAMLTGLEKLIVIKATASVAVGVALNVLLIPRWGIEGAAVATAFSVAVLQLVIGIALVRRFSSGVPPSTPEGRGGNGPPPSEVMVEY